MWGAVRPIRSWVEVPSTVLSLSSEMFLKSHGFKGCQVWGVLFGFGVFGFFLFCFVFLSC